jgi:hypothetical protein
VTITITPSDAGPVVAFDDIGLFSTVEDTPLTVTSPPSGCSGFFQGVLANDTTPAEDCADPVTLNVVTPPANGTVQLNNNGSFTYTPDQDFNGVDTFVYNVNDGFATSNDATVEIIVTADDDPPTAVADRYLATAGVTLNVVDTTALIDRGSSWSYLDRMENGNHVGPPAGPAESYPTDAEGDTWVEEDYDTATAGSVGAWLVGNGLFAGPLDGLGPDGATFLEGIDDSVVVAGENSVTTYLYRKTFTIASGGASVTSLIADAIIDDGALIYFNGVEATAISGPDVADGRIAMPMGAITSTTFASAEATEDYAIFFLSVPAGTLHDGVNTIAVEVHQQNLTSSDAGFDMALAVAPGPGVIYNDTDIEGDAITNAQVTTPPTVGALSLNPDGTFTYTAPAGFAGGDVTFEYTVESNGLTSAPGVVTITVAPATCANDTDLDNDGDTDRRDLALLSQNYGATGAFEDAGDVNCDGTVALTDLVALRNNLTPPPSPAASEPITVERPASNPVIVVRTDAGQPRLQLTRKQQQPSTGTSSTPLSAVRSQSVASVRARRHAHDRAMDDMFGG